MAKHGHRVAHIAAMRARETAADPVAVAMAEPPRAAADPPAEGAPERIAAPEPLPGLPRYDLAGVAVVAAGIAMAGAAILLF